jgi:hypothetical protein
MIQFLYCLRERVLLDSNLALLVSLINFNVESVLLKQDICFYGLFPSIVLVVLKKSVCTGKFAVCV